MAARLVSALLISMLTTVDRKGFQEKGYISEKENKTKNCVS